MALFIDILITLVILFLVTFGVMNEYYSRRYSVPAMPTMPWAYRPLRSLLIKYCGEMSAPKIVELGCGWGGLFSVLSKSVKGSSVVAYEIAPLPFAIASFRSLFFNI